MDEAVDLDVFSNGENGINTYNEKPLHAALKQWYARPGDLLETRIDGYIIDLVRGDLLVEIQTGSFSALKRKLARLVENHPIRLVFPIPVEKWIILTPLNGGVPRRRKSPKHGSLEYVFNQLVYLPGLMAHEHFSLEVLLTREEEARTAVEKKHRRHKGWVLVERRLLEVVGSHVFNTPEELASLFSASLEVPFTTRELAKKISQPVWLARKIVYCLREMGMVNLEGKKGRAYRYARIP